MTDFISQLHTELRRTRLTKRGATHNAKDVPHGKHKEYPRMEQIVLPAPAHIKQSFSELLARRHSCDTCSPDIPVTLAELSTLLGNALGRRGTSTHRNYPSGGGLYPIETYVIASNIEECGSGAFHYNPSAHALEKLWNLPDGYNIKDLVRKPDHLIPSLIIVFSAVWKRSSAKYGDFVYGLALLEAGHMSENVLLAATALNLDARPMAGFDDDMIAELLDFPLDEEQTVLAILLGKPSALQTANKNNVS